MVKSKRADLELLAKWLDSGLVVPVDETIDVRNVASGLSKLSHGGVVGRIAVNVAGAL